MKKYNILYLTTYIDEDIEKIVDLPYAAAGLKKKREMLKILTDHNVNIVFVSLFSRFKNIFVRKLKKKINNIIVHMPFFTKLPLLNYIINPISVFFTMYKLNKAQKIDCIIMYNCVYENVIPAYMFQKFYSVKIICQYEDGWAFSSHGLKSYVYKFSHNVAHHISHGVIANSTNFLKVFDKKDVFVFRGNIEAGLDKEPKTNSQVCPDSKLNVVFSSNLDDIRGINLLIEMFNNIDDKTFFEHFSFFITGKGDDKIVNSLKDSISYFNKKGGTAKYCGFVSLDELKNLYSSSHILLALQNPGHKFSEYCFPSKIFEYYQYNKPIVTTQVSDLTSDEFFNLEFIEYDFDALYNSLVNIYCDYSTYKDKNKLNSRRLSTFYSIENNKKRVNTLLENLIE